LTVTDYIAEFLAGCGVSHVYYIAGGMISFLQDSIYHQDGISLVTMHHEQGAGFAAEGGARMTVIPGVAIATSGPGVTNLLRAVGSCFYDSAPSVLITGQVNRSATPADSLWRRHTIGSLCIQCRVGRDGRCGRDPGV
jgi:acetolactate synthase-1/2/3 large subunit